MGLRSSKIIGGVFNGILHGPCQGMKIGIRSRPIPSPEGHFQGGQHGPAAPGVSTFLVGQTIVLCRLPSIRRSTIAIGGGRPPSRPLRDYSRYRRSNLGALRESVSNGRTIRLAKKLCRSALESGLTGEPFFPSAIALPSTFQQAAERSHERGSA